MQKHILSKSTFVKGCQCHKALWLNKHRPGLRDTMSAMQQAVFDRGHSVGDLALQLYPGGVTAVPAGEYPSAKWAAKTLELIAAGETIIYEACFMYDQVLCAMDIMVCSNGRWKAYEVKSSTAVSETYILDAALQTYLIRNSGIELDDISIVHINNEYVRMGNIDVKQFFTTVSVMEEIKQHDDFIPQKIDELKKLLLEKEMPVMDIGPHCSSPYKCDFAGFCWSHVPSPSVFEISRLQGDKKFDLYYKGIIKFEDIPADAPLNDSQWLQVRSMLDGTAYYDKPAIADFLTSLNYPLYFLDFESMMPAIPMFDNSRPYQQICTQYSLHVQQTIGAAPEHYDFLGDGYTDPRKEFMTQLVKVIGDKGDIIVYNRAFECTRLTELAAMYPEFSEAVSAINARVVDLMLLFQGKHVYLPAMNGSYSIKAVLPALLPELHYDDLEIGDGGAAMNAYESLRYETDTKRIQQTREALLTYCKLDTFAMLKIVEKLREGI